MKKLILLVAALFAVAGTQYTLQLAPDAVITLKAWSPQELVDAGMSTPSYSGLRVVGVESMVYMVGSEADGEEVLSYEWSVTSPQGVTGPTDDPTAEMTTFRPSGKGTWTVSLTITTASGTASTEITIEAARYVGVGSIAGAAADAGEGQCGACHSHNTGDWLETGHAHLFELGIDGIASDHYAARCISCHTVGYDLTADNDGFDDLADYYGWTFPAETVAGNWQMIVDTMPALAQRANIQCENCHGPGSEHKGTLENIQISALSGVCATCHESGTHHNKPTLWKRSAHHLGTSFSRGSSSGCAGCHSSYGFIARVDPQSNLDQVVGTGEGVECAACHDPHNADLEYQLRTEDDVELYDGTVVTFGGVGKLCMNCHQARRDGATVVVGTSSRVDPHHSPQADMLVGNDIGIHFGRYIAGSTHRDVIEEACVTCHMAATPGTPEEGQYFVGDHTFAMAAEIDGVEVENVEVCVECHGEIEDFDDIMARADYDGDGEVEGARDELRGELENLAMLLPPYGEPTVDTGLNGGAGGWPLMEKKALFNYNYVAIDDGSMGVHNYQYAMGLVKVSIEAMKYGVVSAGNITEINDVPNDQGKKVQVVWTRFGGDGVSDDPVSVYAVLRLDGPVVAGKAPLPDVNEVDLETTSAGTAVVMDGEMWTQVGSAEAFQMDTYSLEVPTLYDEVETTFKVVAKTASSKFVVASPSFVGTSVDNLIPTAPMALAAEVTSSDVTLTWNELDVIRNPDIDYYAVYRGDVEGFVPGEPIATVVDPMFFDDSVVPGNWYYYQVAAFDFSGNQGEFSGEVSAAVSVGTEGMGLPTEYALHQNYPNPFNPSTTIVFDVPAASEISIVVYDLLGRQVKTLVSESVAAGRHETMFDATGLTSGLYIVRMRTGDRVFERSVVLMK